MGSRGWQVFAIDPGETTGWAWACVGVNEARADPACGGLRLALKAGRVQWGEVPRTLTDRLTGEGLPLWKVENIQAQALVMEMVRCQAEGSRLSAGTVPQISTVVEEDFILRERTQDRSLLSPVRVNAKVEYAVGASGIIQPDDIVLQSTQVKRVVTDERLERWGFWVPGKPHARDALRHLLAFMREVHSQT